MIIPAKSQFNWPRDRPFNLKGGGVMVFCFVQNFFFGQHKSQNIFFCPTKRESFFQKLTLVYMTKTLNQIIFFFSTKIRIFSSATLGIRIFFQKKTITPPLQVKWSFPQWFLTRRFFKFRPIRTHYGPWQPCWISNQRQKQKSCI